MTAVVYDTRTRTRKTSYADGTETVIVYDACGNILSATNESGTLRLNDLPFSAGDTTF